MGSHPWALEPRKRTPLLGASALRSTTLRLVILLSAWQTEADLLPPPRHPWGRGLEAQTHVNLSVGLIHFSILYKGDASAVP